MIVHLEIKRLRLSHHLTQAQLAELACKTTRTIQRWESEQNDNWGTLRYVQAVLNLYQRGKKEIPMKMINISKVDFKKLYPNMEDVE